MCTQCPMLVVSGPLGNSPPLPPAPFPLDNTASGEYEVNDILDSCLGHFVPEYLMKWLGYPVFETMLELASHLANVPDILN